MHAARLAWREAYDDAGLQIAIRRGSQGVPNSISKSFVTRR
jgi:hypothetical protein